MATALIASAALTAPAGAVDSTPMLEKHQAANVKCASCHKESGTRKSVANKVCQDCHGTQTKLAQRTAQAHPNPHAPPHLAAGEAQACNDCHRAHQPSEVACNECHRGFKFNINKQ
ncbi:MAG: cytochrome c3 family protein [Burkholderiaceae bacterium]|nr:cytochrome c3 family protein [Burkholderiaceae bacterium]